MMKSGSGCVWCFASRSPHAQAPPAGGVSSEWDVRKLLDSLNLQAQHLKPIIDQVKPETWVAKGAPEAYVTQWNTAQAELRYLLSSSDALSKSPNGLPGAGHYFRMQAMESTLGSVTEGIRKYQNPALADLMQSVVAENSSNATGCDSTSRIWRRKRKQEFQIADREAQRCRETLLKQPAASGRRCANDRAGGHLHLQHLWRTVRVKSACTAPRTSAAIIVVSGASAAATVASASPVVRRPRRSAACAFVDAPAASPGTHRLHQSPANRVNRDRSGRTS